MNDQQWNAERILETARSYQSSAVIVAAAELDLFSRLEEGSISAGELARTTKCDPRGMQVLLDALAALGLVLKDGPTYSLTPSAGAALSAKSPQTVLGMVRHQGSCLRKWAQLGRVVKTGARADQIPSVRGAEGDLESFIDAMHNISDPVADAVIAAVVPPAFKCVLDVGGASGTWTAAFLRACRTGRAILLDLPEVIDMAKRRLGTSGFSDRVNFATGDYLVDPMPRGADLAWLSAVVHQNSPAENRDLFRRVHDALEPGGRIAIRDIIMEEDRSKPPGGALFAVNMLVATDGGGTFTFNETRVWLEQAGFRDVSIARHDPGMHAIIVARKA